jgi:hypothetical protein
MPTTGRGQMTVLMRMAGLLVPGVEPLAGGMDCGGCAAAVVTKKMRAAPGGTARVRHSCVCECGAYSYSDHSLSVAAGGTGGVYNGEDTNTAF